MKYPTIGRSGLVVLEGFDTSIGYRCQLFRVRLEWLVVRSLISAFVVDNLLVDACRSEQESRGKSS
ncbi:MAG: hypothetical protein ACM65L_25050 [Microcoleus sp.]